MGTTPKFAWPYPDPADLVRDAPTAFENLADSIEATLDGTILQVVSTAKTDTFTTTSTTPADVTGLSVAITPSGTANKVLVVAMVNLSGPGTSSNTSFAQLVRTSTAIAIGDAAGTRTQASVATGRRASNLSPELAMFASPIVWLDSPATVSATTYKIQAWASTGTTAINRLSDSDSDAASYPRLVSTITAFEVAA